MVSFDEITYSKRGILPFLFESRETFLTRAKSIPSLSHVEENPLEKVYAIEPDWVKLIYNNKNLHWWEGGCTWCEEGIITVQLREVFRSKKKLYWFYDKEELWAHEMVHAVRMPLNSDYFEEIFAYQTSKSAFRKTVGPIIHNTRESTLYLAIAGCFLFTFPWPLIQRLFFLLLSFLLIFGVVRLIKKTTLFNRAKKHAALLVGKDLALPFLLHLTDREILSLAKNHPLKITGEARAWQIRKRFRLSIEI